MLLELLQSKHSSIRRVMLNVVGMTGAALRSPPVLKSVLHSSLQRHRAERRGAVRVISRLGPAAVTHDYLLRLFLTSQPGAP